MFVETVASSSIIVGPTDTVAVVGSSATFSCQTNLNNVRICWNFFVNANTTRKIARGFVVNKEYTNKFTVGFNNETYVSNLTILNVTSADESQYECEECEQLKTEHSARLHVVDGETVC